jgi:EAL domain-containing protein (putative c-di-GMP-specific phosphodiesterase class I)
VLACLTFKAFTSECCIHVIVGKCLATFGGDFVQSAIFEDRVICSYQPIYDYKTDKVIKYEALVRIIDNGGSVIPPFLFMPNIEHTNIHYKITRLIITIVLDKFEKNNACVSINLNYSDLINQDIEDLIEQRLKNNPALASRITFEILESDEIENIELFTTKIEKLHSFGSHVSIDDFGSGYSNFKTVLDMKADYLKIDGSLVKNIDKNEKDFKVVKNIIRFAQDTNMKTIAEFVHSKEVYDKLIELDVDYMQGYYIAPPNSKLLNEEEIFKE